MRHFEAVEVEIWFFEVEPSTEFVVVKFFSMPRNKRLHHGVGAKISAYKKFPHPWAAISKKSPNGAKNDVLDNLLVIGQEEKLVSNRRQVCSTPRFDDFDEGKILHAIALFCRVSEERPIESLFNSNPTNDVENAENVAIEGGAIEALELPTILNEDVLSFWNSRFSN